MTIATIFQRLRDPGYLAFGTPGVSRVFLACQKCRKVKPHYHLYAPRGTVAKPRCRCGSVYFTPIRISEVSAAFRVLVLGWLWRKVIRKYPHWDPRLPIREVA